MQSQRVLGRAGARVLAPEETKRVSAGSSIVLKTATMSFIGTNDPDFKPDYFTD